MVYDYFDNLIKKTPVDVVFDEDVVSQYIDDRTCLISGYYTFILQDGSELKAKYSFYVDMISESNYRILLHNSGRRNA